MSRSLDQEQTTIRATILDERVRKALGDLVAKLRADQVSEIHPELCDVLNVTETGASTTPGRST